MPPVPNLITDLSTTIASNSPAGSESPASLDDYQRAHAAFIAQLHANTVAATTVIVASATSTAIGAAASENVDISGTTTITSFDNVAEGINRKGRFTGALTLTHNATSLILPGNANITTAANDRYEARSLGAGNWIVTKYVYASGNVISATNQSGGTVNATSATAVIFTATAIAGQIGLQFTPGAVFEAGRYIDFHGTTSVNDYDVRIDSGTTGTLGGGSLTISGTGGMSINGPISGTTVTASGALTQSGGYANIGSFNSAGVYPPTNTGLAIANNFTSGGAEQDIWNTFDPVTYPSTGISFYQKLTATTNRLLLSLLNTGAATFAGAITGAGYSGGPISGTTVTASGAISGNSATAVIFTATAIAGQIGLQFTPGAVFEAGRYIDFHGTTSANDYDVRIDSGTTGTLGGGSLTISGTGGMSINGPISGTTITASGPISGTTITASGAVSGTTITGSASGMPKFSAYHGTAQAVTSNLATQALFGTEDFDTNANFASSRFTPTVAGYYKMNWTLDLGANTNTLTSAESHLRKNGSMYASAGKVVVSASLTEIEFTGTTIVYMNGTTDYLEVWGTAVGTTPYFNYSSTSSHQRFSGALLV